MKRVLLLLSTGFLLIAGCGYTEKTEAITAEIMAAQMEGRKAAGRILGPEWKDTVQLQKELLDIKSRQSEYLINNKPHCAEAFDSTFISTIRAINPALARKIKN